MSCLTRMLQRERARSQVDPQTGQVKTPLILQIPLPPELGHACISLRKGDFRLVRIARDRPTRTGFFELPHAYVDSGESLDEGDGEDSEEIHAELYLHPPSDEEDRVHASLVKFLHEQGVQQGWGGAVTRREVTPACIQEVTEYFEAYDLAMHQVFCGFVGWVSLYTTGILRFPEGVPTDFAEDRLTAETLEEWMSTYYCVGRLGEEGVPVYYNPKIGLDIAFTVEPRALGHLYRVDERAAVLVHNAERGCVTIRVLLGSEDENEENEHEEPDELPEHDPGASADPS